MVLRPSLAVLLPLLLASPSRGNPNIVGSVASSQFAFVRGASLTPGSTVFNGDILEVRERGIARIALTGGAQVLLAENSLALLTRADKKVQLAIERGQATFRSTENAAVEALLADATIRLAGNAPAVGVIIVRNAQSAFIGAEKGALEIYTAHDGKSVTLHEGDGMEVTMMTTEPSANPKKPRPAGKAMPRTPWSARKTLILGAVLAGAATGIGVALDRREPTHSDICLEVSPLNVLCK